MAYPPGYMEWLRANFRKEKGRLPFSDRELLDWQDMWGGEASPIPGLVAAHDQSSSFSPEWNAVPGAGNRMSSLQSGTPRNALSILAGRQGGGGYEGVPSSPSGGPEDMVRSAIMQELRYLLAPDVSAAPLAPDALKAMGAGAEYQNLDYDTPLSNPRAAEAIGPLMEMYAGVGRARQQEQMGEQELSGARAREDLTRAQAENYRKYGGTKNPYKPGEAKAVLDTLGKTYRQAMAMIARIDKETVGGLVDLGNGPEQSAEVRARLQQQIDAMKRAAQLGDAANTAEQSGDYQAAMDYANQARMLMLQYGIEDTGVATGTPVQNPQRTYARPGDAFLE